MTYELRVMGPAVRAIREELPQSIAAASGEFITGPLVENPYRVGKELRRKLAGRWSARRGSYRVIYRVDEAAREVFVLRIQHRRKVYRT